MDAGAEETRIHSEQSGLELSKAVDSNSSDEGFPTDEEFDSALCELLDQYVEALQSGDLVAKSNLLAQHPHLEQLVGCLEQLDSLAIPPAAAAAPGDSLKTVPSDATSRLRYGVADSVNPELPQEFGKYELLEELGRGGMGVVYKARQIDLDRVVALKMILASQFASPDEVRRFYAEARAAGSLKHANIVGIHEVGQEYGQHYFAMDCIDGPSLANVLKEGPMEPEAAAKCLVAVARAVDYLHSHNIIHRDLKPGNILLDDDFQPYVTDFGLAKIFLADTGQTRTGTIIGTPSYMAPEQAAGRLDDVSHASDVYSLGAILYEALTGRAVFKEENPLDTLVQVLEREPAAPTRLNPNVPRALELICLRCLEKDAKKRYASAAEFGDDLERFLRGEPVLASHADIGQRARRWIRREPALVSRLFALFVASAIVQGNYLTVGTDWPYHSRIMTVFGIWAVMSFIFQQMLNKDFYSNPTRFAWTVGDAALLAILLSIAEGPLGPLLIGYPTLIVASGLFFRVRLVVFETITCLLSFATLCWLRPELTEQRHYPLIFAAVLSVIGFVVGYQVFRVRVLSRYFESRRVSL